VSAVWVVACLGFWFLMVGAVYLAAAGDSQARRAGVRRDGGKDDR